MPHLGLPVHPVQIYDALLGFITFVILLVLYQKGKCEGNSSLCSFWPTLSGVSLQNFLGRFLQGRYILLTLSVSQLISFVIFFVVFGLSVQQDKR